ncbi:TPA: replication initiation protein [Serratia fonticola]|jgi:plasmid replication initiation protein
MCQNEKLVTQANQLIEGSFDITLTEVRLLYLALTKVESKKPQPEGEYTIYAKEYNDMFHIGRVGYDQVKSAVDSLSKKPIVTYEWNEKKNQMEKVQRFWFSSIRYGVGNSTSDITLRFSDTVRDYLYQLSKEFTQMNLVEMVRLDSPFAFRLYSWLHKYKNLNNSRNKSGVISTEPLLIDWMKERTGLMGKYPELADFRRRVIDPAIQMINANTKLSVSYDLVRSGRKFESMIFNYIDETDISMSERTFLPLRPRLPRRPHVTKGSSAEGDWARRCIVVMKDYLVSLREYDPKLKLSKADLRKIETWHKIIGNDFSKKFWYGDKE